MLSSGWAATTGGSRRPWPADVDAIDAMWDWLNPVSVHITLGRPE
jgi:uncharacterized protein (DUF2236 family)